jgi:hypothetical protein
MLLLVIDSPHNVNRVHVYAVSNPDEGSSFTVRIPKEI